MKPTLSLRIGQQLAMTPQLQQAIKLLQLSALDLEQEILQAVESNPMLELEDEFESRGQGETSENLEEQPTESSADEFQSLDDSRDSNIPTDLPIDTEWDDIYQNDSLSGTGSAREDDWNPEDRNGDEESLRDHLSWQLNLAHLSARDRLIGEAIIDSINDDGLLDTTVEEICASLNRSFPAEAASEDADPFDVDEISAVLKFVQQFEPTGVAARDLGECLRLQLDQLPPDTPWRNEAERLVVHHLELLGNREFQQLCRHLGIDEGGLTEVIQLIQRLNPRPGSTIARETAEYVVPDVFVNRRNNRWVVELNADAAPRLRINQTYAALVRRADSSSDNVYLRDHLQEARWFLKSLQSRNETLLKVATKIVERQRGFLDHGPEAMRPLVLADIAEAVEMHESTISRVTTRKYMHTPRGIFEFKYFFSSHVATQSGGEVSSTAIRAIIQKLIAEENPRKPLSDQKIAAILTEQKIIVARRTVAKYRESLNIPPSNERKRLV